MKRLALAGHRQMSAERRCTVVYADMCMFIGRLKILLYKFT